MVDNCRRTAEDGRSWLETEESEKTLTTFIVKQSRRRRATRLRT